MEKGANLKIIKLEKGPLQRFKNQNLLLKKFGEVGLQVYKVITGKRTTEELRADLDMDPDLFTAIITYMEEAGMVELKPIDGEVVQADKKKEDETEISEEKKEDVVTEEQATEKPIEPIMEIEKEEVEEKPVEEEEKTEEEKEESNEEEEEISEKIEPIGAEEEIVENEEKEEKPVEEEEKTEEEKEESNEEEEEIAPEEEIKIEQFAEEVEQEEIEDELSPVEKIIKEKYGEIGLKVYELIDGQRTAEEIMKETGLSESKLVEILDFMDAQGIIKLEYPKGKREEKEKEAAKPPTEAITPIIDEEIGEIKDVSPVIVPIKAPSNIIKDVQLKAKIILKFGEKGKNVYDAIDGKNDIIDIAMKVGIPLYEVESILNFLLENKAIFLKPLSRTEIRKKYGDEGYSVYKKYGKEGLMLYELIGKDLTIKQMAERVIKDKEKFANMFLFIYEVLRIDLPLDKEMLYKQLGI
jgi:hypothetical protein